jgi:hypothetical protein
MEWSDDFDANTNKDNRFYVWLKTTTLLAPCTRRKNVKYTYPTALGLKGDNHDKVEDQYANDLKAFQTSPLPLVCHGGKKKMVRVYVALVASLQVSAIYMALLFVYAVGIYISIYMDMLPIWDLYEVLYGYLVCLYYCLYCVRMYLQVFPIPQTPIFSITFFTESTGEKGCQLYPTRELYINCKVGSCNESWVHLQEPHRL